MKKFIRGAVTVTLLSVIAVSGCQLYRYYREYAKEKAMHELALEHKPTEPNSTETAPFFNQNILDLQKQNADVVGWLTVPATDVDYPFVQGNDNSYYLHRDLNESYASAGTIFIDYRCEKDFSGFNTILYGHHMKNGSMFRTLKNFNNREFLESHHTATIFLENKTIMLEIFAFLVIQANDSLAYKTRFSQSEKEEYLRYVQNAARYYRALDLQTDDRFVTLSTCTYEFENARAVVLGRICE